MYEKFPERLKQLKQDRCHFPSISPIRITNHTTLNMGLFVSRIIESFSGLQEKRLLLLGLDAAGEKIWGQFWTFWHGEQTGVDQQE